MRKADDIKEKLIDVTTKLITESAGDIDSITTRMIAKKANVGVGLVNYHFQTKENLIEICVQRIIRKVISSFQPGRAAEDVSTRLKHTAKLVMDFLMENQPVSRISILGDYKNPKPNDNTMGTVRGFSHSTGGKGAPQGRELITLFALTAAMSSMFLRKDVSKDIFGIDMYNKEERGLFVENLVDILLCGFINE